MTTATPTAMQRLMRMSLISQIAIGLLLGIALALLAPGATPSVALLGDLFISALKAVAPVLVFVLVMAAIANHKHGQPTHIRPVLTLYLLGTLAAALVAVLASLTFPTTLVLDAPKISGTPPGGIIGVLKNLLLSAFSNPVKALMEANFERLAEAHDEDPVMHIESREIHSRRRAGGVIWFDFQTLCGGPRSQNDYLEIATQFHTVLLSNVPQMAVRQASEARRFTWLIDVLYDRRVKLVISAAVAPELLYVEGPMSHEFPRTVSRLGEMQSAEFLALEHRTVDTGLT